LNTIIVVEAEYIIELRVTLNYKRVNIMFTSTWALLGNSSLLNIYTQA